MSGKGPVVKIKPFGIHIPVQEGDELEVWGWGESGAVIRKNGKEICRP